MKPVMHHTGNMCEVSNETAKVVGEVLCKNITDFTGHVFSESKDLDAKKLAKPMEIQAIPRTTPKSKEYVHTTRCRSVSAPLPYPPPPPGNGCYHHE